MAEVYRKWVDGSVKVGFFLPRKDSKSLIMTYSDLNVQNWQSSKWSLYLPALSLSSISNTHLFYLFSTSVARGGKFHTLNLFLRR